MILRRAYVDLLTQRCTVFVNRPHGIDFEQAAAEMDERPGTRLGAANTARPQADFTLLEHAPGVTAYPVSVSRFSQTQSVSLLLVRGHSDTVRLADAAHLARLLHWFCGKSTRAASRYRVQTRRGCGKRLVACRRRCGRQVRGIEYAECAVIGSID